MSIAAGATGSHRAVEGRQPVQRRYRRVLDVNSRVIGIAVPVGGLAQTKGGRDVFQ